MVSSSSYSFDSVTNSSSSKASPALPPSPSSMSSSSASSYKHSSDPEDEENVTITRSLAKNDENRQSQEDLRLLAVSTLITELSYSISDIQTRIFEIQELRHKSQSSTDTTSTTNVIDQSLMNLNEKLDGVEKGMKSINESLDPLLQIAATPTFQHDGEPDDNALIIRKHAALQSEWDAIRNESDVLREELKEDKWLTVFRTVTDQADGMMSSLEKAVNRCQDFIWQVHRRGVDDPRPSQLSLGQHDDNLSALTLEVFTPLLDSFEAKKKHYMPATSKVLAIIDKGVRDRVTKNGETLRRHAESAQRWKNLRERISRTDTEMESVRRLLVNSESTPSEISSSTSTKNGYLATPPSGSRAPSSASTISSSMSPLRKFARKITGTPRAPPVTPLSVTKNPGKRTPTSEPVPTLRKQKTSLFSSMRGSQPTTPITPNRPGHKHSQSLTPESSPRAIRVDTGTIKSRATPPTKQKWNSSTKVESEPMGRGTPPKRPPSSTGTYSNRGDIPPVPPLGAQYRRSISRASMVSSRPWSPITTTSTTQSSQPTHFPVFRPPSRAQTPVRNRSITPSFGTMPRTRPKTPSHIPQPSKQLPITPSRLESALDDDDLDLQPAFFLNGPPPRPPSRSMIPIPSVHLSTPSRPSSSMSFRSTAARAQTPEHTLRANVQRIALFPGTPGTIGRSAARPSIATIKLPPSSFKDNHNSTGSRAPSRSGSRLGAYTQSMENLTVHEYIPTNPNDPLDAEVAAIVNSTMHGLLIERLDPPLKTIPKKGEEIKARYAFTNTLSRKELTCRLTTLTRLGKAGDTTSIKRVMCRIGGGGYTLTLSLNPAPTMLPTPLTTTESPKPSPGKKIKQLPAKIGQKIKHGLKRMSSMSHVRHHSSVFEEAFPVITSISTSPLVHHPFDPRPRRSSAPVSPPSSTRTAYTRSTLASVFRPRTRTDSLQSSRDSTLISMDDSFTQDKIVASSSTGDLVTTPMPEPLVEDPAELEVPADSVDQNMPRESALSEETAFSDAVVDVNHDVPDPFLIDDDLTSDEEDSAQADSEDNSAALTPTEVPLTSLSPSETGEMSGTVPSLNLDKEVPPTPIVEETDEDETPDLYLPGLILPTMFLPIPNTDPLTILLTKYIFPPEKRPTRDVTGDWHRDDFEALVMTNSWRSLAKMARDRLVSANPENVPLILNHWYLRLACLARLRLFNQASSECTNLFVVLNAIEPLDARKWIFERLLPFELEVIHARVKYWAGDHMGHLDALNALLRKCRSNARRAKDTDNVSMWKERGVRDFRAAIKLLEPLCEQGQTSTAALRSSIARIYLQSGEISTAAKHFEIVSADPSAGQELNDMNCALLACAEGNWAHAHDLLQKLISQDANNFVAVNNLSVALLGQGKVREGIEALETALKTSPSSVVVAEPFLFNLSFRNSKYFTATLYELHSATAAENKRNLLLEVAKWSGDGLRVTCLKMPTN
ncbi:hypothetical protein H0H93_010147 [Arthromyces matolae]|nr:hypothetical protein H0H93_010147 [Arthromyces matolae]